MERRLAVGRDRRGRLKRKQLWASKLHWPPKSTCVPVPTPWSRVRS